MKSPPMRIIIVGGGSAGWMAAAGLTRAFKPSVASIRLIESEEIGTVGVGEATLPQVKEFNDFIGINEAEFMRATQATFKLGIEFRDWFNVGDSYIHPFGVHGQPIGGVAFLQHWLRARQGGRASALEDYSFAIAAARAQRFDFPSTDERSIRSSYAYAYHFDAGLYAQYLRALTEARGLTRTQGKVVEVRQRPEDGFIEALVLQSGEVVEGDLFIDCSGFRGLLIDQTLKAGWEDWTDWLPCDRALAVPCERTAEFTPYTRATAREAGWTWRIPLQHRTGNGYVFASRFTSEARAEEVLLSALDAKPLADPRLLRFEAGRRKTSWAKNCVAIGLASGFLEPLESTSLYLAQVAITFLIQLLPNRRFDPKLASEFNRLIDIEYERVRDFLILHYHATARNDGELWRHVQSMAIPESLKDKIEMFRRRGHIHQYKDGLFNPASWTAVFMGQNVVPQSYDPQAGNFVLDRIVEELDELRERVVLNVEAMPAHADFIADYCYVVANG